MKMSLNFEISIQNQEGTIDLQNVSSPEVGSMIKAYADNISVPYEYIFYPLLSAIGSLIRVNGKVYTRWMD